MKVYDFQNLSLIIDSKPWQNFSWQQQSISIPHTTNILFLENGRFWDPCVKRQYQQCSSWLLHQYTKQKCSICISDYMQTTFFYLERFLEISTSYYQHSFSWKWQTLRPMCKMPGEKTTTPNYMFFWSFYMSGAVRLLHQYTTSKCSICISDYMQTTFYYLRRFLEK